jgi:hypothetical protein
MAPTKALWATNFLDLNDSSEYFYTWSVIQRDAFDKFIEFVPAEKRLADYNYDQQEKAALVDFKASLRTLDGYGQLYVACFARGRNEDEDKRGILTHWDRYTKHQGYCVQFDRDDVLRLFRFECERYNYFAPNLVEVKYGVDKTAWEYTELVFQTMLVQAQFVMSQRDDIRFDPGFDRMWARSSYLQRLMDYCARHKDPCFSDEREVRIAVHPAPQAESRFMVGLALRKEIKTAADGRRYVALFDCFEPGLRPRSVIVGTKANPDINQLMYLYGTPPLIREANMPIA